MNDSDLHNAALALIFAALALLAGGILLTSAGISSVKAEKDGTAGLQICFAALSFIACIMTVFLAVLFW